MLRFYLTTAIDYVNSRPHLGTAYEKVTADVIARYKRLAGFDTRFLMGNDEHSQNVYQRAREEGLEPLAFCDRMETAFRDVWRRLDISFDDFIRTTEDRHRTGVTALVSRLIESGDVYEGFYEGWYCVSCEAFKQEKDLVDGACPVHQRPPQWIREKNHFFRLSKYREPLLERYAAHPEALEPEIRRNEILRLLEAGLEDISMSRTGQSWGIPVPSDPGSVVYVWMDALINYVSGVGYGTDDALFDTWWPADLHVIGKDITRFHCVVWPAMLMSAGVALPRQVFGHGWVHWQGQKMSKSLGTAVDPLEAVERLGPDPLRLYLTKEIAYGQDGDFTWERFEDRYNVDLANNFGNLVSRIVAMAHRYRQGRLVFPPGPPGPLAATAATAVAGYRQAMDRFALHQGVAAAFRIVDAANEYIANVEPWVVARDPARAAELDRQLCDVSEAVRLAAVLLAPVMPRSCAEVLARVGAAAPADALRLERDGAWQTPPGAERRLVKGPPLWPRIEAGQAAASGAARPARREQKAKEQEAMSPSDAAPPPQEQAQEQQAPEQQEQAPARPRISFDQFTQMELRVGRVAAAEAVPKSRKLLRLEVEDGTGVRQIVAGLARSHPPETLVGRSVVFIANLEPAKLAGLESNGMVLA
ncbi:MAG: methionine--tRNA ligase, partial [Acidobacteriota bacterium]|nr:methionine--tRNA ligase [Acidobacteriota bacterium]